MPKRSDPTAGPSQRQQRVAELVRHALAEVLSRGDIQDPVLTGHVITVPEVRMTPDLKLATIYVMPLAGRDDWYTETIDRLNVPAIELGDGPHGLRKETGIDMVWVPATGFPTASAMGAGQPRGRHRGGSVVGHTAD